MSKKCSSSSTKQPPSTLPSSSTAIVSPVTADATVYMDSLASDLSPPIDDSSMEISTDSDSLPFDLSDEHVKSLSSVTAEEWTQHCRNVRANHPRNEAAIDRFLSLPLEDIVRIFCAEVHWLASLSLSSTSTTIPSSSSAPIVTPSGPTMMAAEDILKLTPSQIHSLTPSVAPKSIPMDLYLSLSSEQVDAMPSFITPITEELVIAPNKKPRKKKNK